MTARDIQREDGQPSWAKAFDTFCPLGPWITTNLDPTKLVVRCEVNGEERQSAGTDTMLHPVASLLAYITAAVTLQEAWKPALAEVGVIPPLPERQPGEKPSRVWEPSREHGFHVLRHTYASVMLPAGESIVSLAKWLGHSDPAFTLRAYTHFMPQAGARGLSAIEARLTDLD